ncbi:AAA family ATPase [Mycobacterium sp. 852002-50816_SCH5313054-b]|uniref:AAA family ATPase n=1 Tax=Mycobacterium sp. 852002-50816_SCH5313054-b TaxID=1834092 RepID=UPI000AA65D62|nr:AAA family ATPase [Mycobacterium sp. 852002-50816_SCH5313054-b]
MVDTSTWCGTAVKSILSLWRNENFARRASTDEKLDYRPTATFHAIVAMGECGVWEPAAKFRDGVLTTSFFEVSDVKRRPCAHDVLAALVHADNVSESATTWAGKRIDESSHTFGKPTFQPSLVIGGLFHALRVLLAAEGLEPQAKAAAASPPGITLTREELADLVCKGFAEATDRLLKLAQPTRLSAVADRKDAKLDPTDAKQWVVSEAELSEHEKVSTNLLLHAAIALSERKRILDGAKNWRLPLPPDSDQTRGRLDTFQRSLTDYFRRQVDRLMARSHVLSDPEYDPTSLAFAVRGLTLLDEQARGTPLFRASVQAVVAGQHADGCWSDGVSVTYQDDGSTIQQPSVEVALCLAESVFHHDLLVYHDADKIEVLNQALEALEKTASYLTASYTPYTTNGDFSGWVSDRTRHPGVAETWITSFAAQLFHTMYLAERARRRAATLHKYVVRNPKRAAKKVTIDVDAGEETQDAGKASLSFEAQFWRKEVTEPDVVLEPVSEVLTKVIEPLAGQRLRGFPILRPNKDGVSFIIYGPPGSGKTFMVEKLAEALGWPLLALSPGHFIRRGLELIESTAAEIFGDLMTLDHTVVFFDECDELFRERSEQSAEGRNILSFATASMLPKLQELHDARRVIFFLGTNFLSNVDIAIRRPGRFDGRLLFDRPDIKARSNLLGQGWKKEPEKEMPEQDFKWAIDQTTGWMSKDVKDLGTALRAKHDSAPARPDPQAKAVVQAQLDPHAEAVKKVDDLVERAQATVDDYLDWCVRAGKAELEAAGLEGTEKLFKVFARWRALPDFDQEFRRRYKKYGPDAQAEADAFLANLRKRMSEKQQRGESS